MHPTTLLCIPTLLVILTGVIAMPLLVLALNRRAFRFYFESPEAAAELLGRSIHLREWVERLKELGFNVMGISTEKLPLWGPAFSGLSLVSTPADTYAGIVLHPDGEPASLYFYTPIRDGGMVFTRNFAGEEVHKDRYSVRNVETINFAAILDDHSARVQEFRDRGLRPAVGSTQAARIAATVAYYDSEYGRAWLGTIWRRPVRNFAIALAFLLAVAIWIAVRY